MFLFLAINTIIFITALLLLISVLSTKLSSTLRVPSLIPFIIVGMFLNRFIYYDNAQATQLFAIIALVIILFEGGLKTKKDDIKQVLIPSISLATLGVLLTSLITGIFAKWILDLSWLHSMLLGAIVGSTDAAAVFAAFGNTNIKKKLTKTLEFESGSNDPMAVFLTLTIISLMTVPETSILNMIGSFFWQMGLGVLLGLTFGKLTVWFINHLELEKSGLYPIFLLSFAILSYSIVTAMNGSGFLAVYLMAIYIGNADIRYKQIILQFNDGFANMMQISMFILLGLLVFPTDLIEISTEGILLSLALMFIARPVAVFLSTIKMPYTFKEKVFLSWAGLKGAVPIMLATYPMLSGIENSNLIFNVVFFIVLTSALIQGTTLTFLAEKLDLTIGETKPVPFRLELLTKEKSTMDIVTIVLNSHSPVLLKSIASLELPDKTMITAIVRDSELISPNGDTILLDGDILYLLAPKKHHNKIKQYFHNKKLTSE